MVAYCQKKQSNSLRSAEVKFVKIPVDDLKWVMKRKPAVIQLFHECWLSDPYGSRWMQINTQLKPTAFRQARKQLSEQGLFIFKQETSILDVRCPVCWLVRNLHGSRVKEFWKKADIATTVINAATTTANTAMTAINTAATTNVAASASSNPPETQSEQGFQNLSVSPQEHLINTSRTLQKSSEVYEVSVSHLQQPFCEAAARETPVESKPQSLASLLNQSGTSSEVSADSKQDKFSEGGAAAEVENSTMSVEQQLDRQEQEETSSANEDNSALVGQVCETAHAYNCRVEEAEKVEMMNFTCKQLHEVLRHLKQRLENYSPLRSSLTKRDLFLFALRSGRYTARE